MTSYRVGQDEKRKGKLQKRDEEGRDDEQQRKTEYKKRKRKEATQI